jgi:hypothetical protein
MNAFSTDSGKKQDLEMIHKCNDSIKNNEAFTTGKQVEEGDALKKEFLCRNIHFRVFDFE